ncbi:MAG: cytochrome P460 family protein [Hyphomicrobiaceae bacterium]
MRAIEAAGPIGAARHPAANAEKMKRGATTLQARILIAVLLLHSSLASRLHAETPRSTAVPPVLATRMNGYALQDFPDFQDNWHLVTTRFRQDTGELRFTYANKLAWTALRAGSTDYPDGAAFAKIGLGAAEDPAFRSSLVPSGTRRYQLMVRNKTRHGDTDGWGYALFDQNGTALATRDGSERETTAACHACHHLVPERGFVFSQPMRTTIGAPPILQQAESRIDFKTVVLSDLPEGLRLRLPSVFKQARLLKGALASKAFEGTLDEIRPTLAVEAARSGLPAILLAANGHYSALVPFAAPNSCATAQRQPGVMLSAFASKALVGKEAEGFSFCQQLPVRTHRIRE